MFQTKDTGFGRSYGFVCEVRRFQNSSGYVFFFRSLVLFCHFTFVNTAKLKKSVRFE